MSYTTTIIKALTKGWCDHQDQEVATHKRLLFDAMETKQIFHISSGDGEFSYTHNSKFQAKFFSSYIKPVLESAIRHQLSANVVTSSQLFSVADLGCGVGSIPLALLTTVIEIVHEVCQEKWGNDNNNVPKNIQMFMNDLPSNDFNMLFTEATMKLQGLRQEQGKSSPLCFMMGVPGSFYDRLFPCHSLHLVHSNYAIHWLSQVPFGMCNEVGKGVNRGSVVASKTSPPNVVKAYCAQFQQDFTSFLNCRSHEVVPNGDMVLSAICRPSIEIWEAPIFKFLYQALAYLVSKEVIEEEKVETFNLPVYNPCKEEIVDIVVKQGSFKIEHMEVVVNESQTDMKDIHLLATLMAKAARAVTESLISYHFGAQLWNELQNLLHQLILTHLQRHKHIDHVSSIVILLKKRRD